MFLKHTRSVGGLLDFDRRLCCKLHIIRLRTHRRIKEIASWVPPRVRKQPPGQHPLHQGQHRKQWSGDAVVAVAAQIHAVDTLLRRAWKPLCEGGCNLSRAGGPAEAA